MIIINQLLFFLLLTSSAYAIIDYLNAAACEDDLENIYSDCFIYDKITKDNQSLICRTYESDKCQKLYKEGCSIVRYCKDLDLETRVYVENKYSESVLQLDLICSTDEKNQPCPIANSYIIENVHNDKITNNTYINDTCKSNKCTKIAINTFIITIIIIIIIITITIIIIIIIFTITIVIITKMIKIFSSFV